MKNLPHRNWRDIFLMAYTFSVACGRLPNIPFEPILPGAVSASRFETVARSSVSLQPTQKARAAFIRWQLRPPPKNRGAKKAARRRQGEWLRTLCVLVLRLSFGEPGTRSSCGTGDPGYSAAPLKKGAASSRAT